jgi:hypothetical protein
VPSGKIHCVALELSIFLPLGKMRKRCFSMPSLHSGGSGTYSSMLAECLLRSGADGNKPVVLMLIGIGASG